METVSSRVGAWRSPQGVETLHIEGTPARRRGGGGGSCGSRVLGRWAECDRGGARRRAHRAADDLEAVAIADRALRWRRRRSPRSCARGFLPGGSGVVGGPRPVGDAQCPGLPRAGRPPARLRGICGRLPGDCSGAAPDSVRSRPPPLPPMPCAVGAWACWRGHPAGGDRRGRGASACSRRDATGARGDAGAALRPPTRGAR